MRAGLSVYLVVCSYILIRCAKAKDILLGMFQFGTDRVTEFLDKGFNFISVGNDLHHMLTQNFAHKEALVECSMKSNKPLLRTKSTSRS